MTKTYVQSGRKRRFRGLAAAASLCFLSFSLAGCSFVEDYVPPGAYDLVEEAAADLELETAGQIELDALFGGGVGLGTNPTFVAVFDDVDAMEVIEERLLREGFSRDSSTATTWKRGSGKEELTIYTDVLEVGDKVTINQDSDMKTMDSPAAVIVIQGQ